MSSFASGSRITKTSATQIAFLLILSALLSGACTVLLGDDFDIGGSGGSGGSSSTSSSTSSGSAGDGGTGGTVDLTPMACDWEDGSIFEVASMDNTLRYKDKMPAILQDGRVRLFARVEDSEHLHIYTIEPDSSYVSHSSTHDVRNLFSLAPLDLNSDVVGALVEHGGAVGAYGTYVSLISVDEEDGSGADSILTHLTDDLGGVENLRADFVSFGTQSTQLALAVSYKQSSLFRAGFLGYDGSPGAPVIFDVQSGTLGENDYKIADMIRDSSGQTHIFLGNRFDGATQTRQFVVPDDVSGTIGASRLIDEDWFIGFGPEDDGEVLTGMVRTDSEYHLYLGHIPKVSAELTQYDSEDLTYAGALGIMDDIPQGDYTWTNGSFLIMGPLNQDTPKDLALGIFDARGGIRFFDEIPFPESADFLSDNYELRKMGTVVGDDKINNFELIGGTLYMMWVVYFIDTDREAIYFGQLTCNPASE